MANEPYTPYPTAVASGIPDTYQHLAPGPEAFGAQTGAALQGAGDTLTQGGIKLGDVLLYKQQLTNEMMANDASTEYMKGATALWGDFQKKTGKDAQAALPQFQNSIQDLWKQHLAAMPNVEARAMLDRGTRYNLNSFMRYGQSYADQQFSHWQDQTTVDRATEMGNQAALAVNYPDRMNNFLSAGADEIRKNGEQKGLDEPSIQANIAKYRGAVLNNIIQTKADNGDVQDAQAMFQQYRPQMDSANVLAVTRRMEPLLRSNHADAVVEAALGGTVTPASTLPQPPSQSDQSVPGGPPSSGPAAYVGQSAVGKPGFANNVANLKYGSSGWDGKGPGYNGFETFATPEQGVKAATLNLIHYAQVQPNITLGQAIERWAPGSDHNDPETYADTVSKETGIGVDDRLPIKDPDKMAALVKAMARVEKGGDNLPSDIAFKQGADAAVNGTPLQSPTDGGPQPPAAGYGLPDKGSVIQRAVQMTGDDPKLLAEVLSKINQRYTLWDAMTAQTRAQLKTQLPAVMDAALKGDQSVQLPSDQMRTVMPPQDYARAEVEFSAAQDIGNMSKGLHWADQAQLQAAYSDVRNGNGPISATIAASAGDDQAMRLKLQTGAETQVKRMIDERQAMLYGASADPAHYVADNPTVEFSAHRLMDQPTPANAANYASAVTGVQDMLGVPSGKQRILSDAMAARFAAAITPKPGQSGEEAVAQIKGGAAQWGSVWPQIVKEIAPNLSDAVRTVTIMDPSQDTAAAYLMEAATMKKELEAQTGGDVGLAIKNNMSATFAPFLKTFQSGGLASMQEGLRVAGQAELLTRRYVALDGMQPAAAVTRAYNEIVGQYDVTYGVRVPKPFDATKVANGAETAAQSLGEHDVDPVFDDVGAGPAAHTQYLASLKQNHYWTNSPDGTGLVLMGGDGKQVLQRGNPFFKSFAELTGGAHPGVATPRGRFP